MKITGMSHIPSLVAFDHQLKCGDDEASAAPKLAAAGVPGAAPSENTDWTRPLETDFFFCSNSQKKGLEFHLF